MFFLLSKLFWLLASPGALLPLLMLVAAFGLYTRWRRAARHLLVGALALFLLIALGPLGAMLLRPLENRFPALPADAPAPTGIIVLGGGVDETVAAARGEPELNEAGDRLTAAVALMRRYARARLVFSGGSGRLVAADWSEAEVARRFFLALGVSSERMSFEDRSRDTYENARFTRDLINPQSGETWLLITSASHMPRAVGVFRQAGFPVTPCPVDYEVTPSLAEDDFGVPSRGLRRAERAVREYLGLLAYWLAGRSNALWPGPSGAALS